MLIRVKKKKGFINNALMYKVCRMTSQGTSLLTKISLCRVYQIKVNCVIKEGKCLI